MDDCPADPDNDADGDGVCGDTDNCPAVANNGSADCGFACGASFCADTGYPDCWALTLFGEPAGSEGICVDRGFTEFGSVSCLQADFTFELDDPACLLDVSHCVDGDGSTFPAFPDGVPLLTPCNSDAECNGGDDVQNDGDGDTYGDACECKPSDATIWGAPSEVLDLLLEHSGGPSGTTTLSWAPPLDPGGTPPLQVDYDTVRSETPEDFATGGSCVEADDGSDTMAIDSTVVAPGSVLYFVVRPQNDDCGQGSAGSTSAGNLRDVRVCP
jgi:hypothetical protein